MSLKIDVLSKYFLACLAIFFYFPINAKPVFQSQKVNPKKMIAMKKALLINKKNRPTSGKEDFILQLGKRKIKINQKGHVLNSKQRLPVEKEGSIHSLQYYFNQKESDIFLIYEVDYGTEGSLKITHLQDFGNGPNILQTYSVGGFNSGPAIIYDEKYLLITSIGTIVVFDFDRGPVVVRNNMY